MVKLGLKVWSTNLGYIKPALELYHEGVFDYVELYVVPEAEEDCLGKWKETGFPFVLHAPHSYGGLNLSLKDAEDNNRALIARVNAFRGALEPEYVIFHSGVRGTIEETIRQINMFKGEFPDLFKPAVIENKPKMGLKGEVCIGSSPEEIKEILDETGLGLCLDIGHAICYAAWKQTDHKKVIDQFIALDPGIFHLCDGDRSSKTDMHLNFGMGNFDLRRIIQRIPADAYVSIETDKSSETDLDDFENDINYFKDAKQNIGT